MNYKKIEKGKYKYELSETTWFSIKNIFPSKIVAPYIQILSKRIVILDGYQWDGATFAKIVPDKYILRASLIHDALYQLIRKKYLDIKYKSEADKIFYDVCREDGMNIFLALFCYYSVKTFGSMFLKN